MIEASEMYFVYYIPLMHDLDTVAYWTVPAYLCVCAKALTNGHSRPLALIKVPTGMVRVRVRVQIRVRTIF